MSHGIRTDDRQLAEDLKLCQEAAKDLMPDSVLYFRLDARKATGLIEELIDLRSSLSRVEAERDALRRFVDIEADILEEQGFSADADRFRETLADLTTRFAPAPTEGEKP